MLTQGIKHTRKIWMRVLCVYVRNLSRSNNPDSLANHFDHPRHVSLLLQVPDPQSRTDDQGGGCAEAETAGGEDSESIWPTNQE